MSTAKSRRDQFSEATRTAVLDAATKRFAELGFAGTSLEDVAADIQATRGAVYHHFASKKALFEAVLEELETEAIRLAKEAGDRGDDPWARAMLALNAFLDNCLDPVYGRVIWREAPIALGWTRWEELEEKYAYGLIEHYVREVMASGAIAQLPIDVTARITFHLLGSVGQALGNAEDSEKAKVRDDYALVLGRLLSGLRETE